MFKISSDSQIASLARLIQPVLSFYVIRFPFMRGVGRGKEREFGIFGQEAADADTTEVGRKQILFFTIEVNLKVKRVVRSSISRRPTLRNERVTTVVYITYHADFPMLVGCISHISLIIKVVGLIFSFAIERAEQIAIGLIPYTIKPSQALCGKTYIGISPQ